MNLLINTAFSNGTLREIQCELLINWFDEFKL